jgi:hypothetical protein
VDSFVPFLKQSPNDLGILQSSSITGECWVAGSTKIPVRVGDTWLEVSLADISKPQWKDTYRVICWSGSAFMTSEAAKPRIKVSTTGTLHRLRLENEDKFIASASTHIAINLHSPDPRVILHPQVSSIRTIATAHAREKEELLSPVETGYVIPSTIPDFLGKSLFAKVVVIDNRIKHIKSEYVQLFSMTVPYVGNFITSSGLIVRCKG